MWSPITKRGLRSSTRSFFRVILMAPWSPWARCWASWSQWAPPEALGPPKVHGPRGHCPLCPLLLKAVVISNGSKNVRNVIQTALKQLFFFQQKLQKIAQGRPPDLCLWYVWFKLVRSLRLPIIDNFENLFDFWFKSSTFGKIRFYANPGPDFWSSRSTIGYLCPKKVPLFEKTWWRHCVRLVVWPTSPIKHPSYVPRQGFF